MEGSIIWNIAFVHFSHGMTVSISTREILEMQEAQGLKSFIILSAYALPKEEASRLGSLA